MARQKITRLGAINTMLLDIGEAPLDDISQIDSIWEAARANDMLNNITLEVLNKGYSFNAQTLTLSPDVDGFIAIPDDVLCVTGVSSVTERGNKLYDVANNTDVFSTSQTVSVLIDIDFDDLPFPAQKYVRAKASRKFMKNSLSSSELNRQLAEDEQEALIDLERFDCRDAAYNLSNNNDFYSLISRGRRN